MPEGERVTKPVIFSVTNHHIAASGTPPNIDDTAPSRYLGYFENELGEQAIFVYDRATQEGVVYLGDANWERPWRVRNGIAEGLVLSSREQAWLRVCWQSATTPEASGTAVGESTEYSALTAFDLEALEADYTAIKDLDSTSMFWVIGRLIDAVPRLVARIRELERLAKGVIAEDRKGDPRAAIAALEQALQGS
jgi:hypothetical protein